MNTEEETDNQTNNRPWLFKKGQSGNPAGRPKTKTLKEFARAYLAGLTDEERIEYFEGLDKKVIWEMAEGKPDTNGDLNVKGNVVIAFDQAFNGTTPETESNS